MEESENLGFRFFKKIIFFIFFNYLVILDVFEMSRKILLFDVLKMSRNFKITPLYLFIKILDVLKRQELNQYYLTFEKRQEC